VLFIVSNAMPVRFERQTSTNGIPVCIMLNPASYSFVGVEKSERAGTYATERERERERERELTYLMMWSVVKIMWHGW